MGKRLLPALALLAATAMAMPAFGNDSFTKSVTFAQDVNVAGTQVPSGDYKVEVNGNDVKIEKGHKVVVTTQAKLEQRKEKYDTTAVVFDSTGKVQEIRLGGRSEALVFGGGSMSNGQ